MRLFLLLVGVLLSGCAEDAATWTYDTAEPEDSESEEGSEEEFEEDDWEDGEGGEEEIIYEKVMWGYVEGSEGWTGLYYADPELGGVLCDVIYDLDDWALTEDCADCVEAWIFTRGADWIEVNEDQTCEAEGWLGLDGSSFGVGYSEESLMVELGDGWQPWEDGDGEIEGDLMFFEFALDR